MAQLAGNLVKFAEAIGFNNVDPTNGQDEMEEQPNQ